MTSPLSTDEETSSSVIDPNENLLRVGSDVDIAGRVTEDLSKRFGQIVHTEDSLWYCDHGLWVKLARRDLQAMIAAYDGYLYPNGRSNSAVRLNRTRIDSIADLVSQRLDAPNFFAEATMGVLCKSGLLTIGDGGQINLRDPDPGDRIRWRIDTPWSGDICHKAPAGSLLATFLGGIFADDADRDVKTDLLAEIAAAALFRMATKLKEPKAIILKGETAANGKSEFIQMVRALLPAGATSSIPIDRFSHDRHIVHLNSKLFNAVDELSASGVCSERFKAVITGNPVAGRDVFKSRQEFLPVAQHVFATNTMPPFKGGVDRGVLRRLLIVQFNRTIPPHERIEAIGTKIVETEAELLLSWVIGGLSRLIRNGCSFSEPESSDAAIRDWLYGADSFAAWFETAVTVDGTTQKKSSDVYEAYKAWAYREGFRTAEILPINTFGQRLKAADRSITTKRTGSSRYIVGVVFDTVTPKAIVRGAI